MATGSVLMCHNFPGNCFVSQHPTLHYFHPFSSHFLLSKPINVVGQDLFPLYHTYQESLSFFDHLRPHPLPYANYETPPSLLPEGVELELHTLPVDARAVADGDTITVYVNALEDPTQISWIPPYVLEAHLRRNEAKAMRNYAEADALQQIINNSGFRVIKFDNEEVLVRKYRIRLRGIDAPESGMPYGKEATEELTRIVEGKFLRILVYEIDCYGRLVGDIYCDNTTFVQELMLKKGCAWYYPHYDKREELKNWENEAKVNQVGLWASSDPEEPWEWRKSQRKIAINAVPRHNYKKIIPPRLQRIAKMKNRIQKT